MGSRRRVVVVAFALATLFAPETRGQTCAEKKKKCDEVCANEARSFGWRPGQAQACKNDCYNRQCGTVTSTPPPPLRPWDIFASSLDPNGFLRNPVWNWSRGRRPEEWYLLLDACDDCPCGGPVYDAAQSWMQTDTCVSAFQNLQTNGNSICSKPTSNLNSTGSGIPYHMNWAPIWFDGNLTWEDHSQAISPGGDDDYNFFIRRPDLPSGLPDFSLVTKSRESIEVEFNASETVDNWDDDQYKNTWWHHFHHDVVDAWWNDNDKRITLFGTHRAIIVGVFGLDLAHKDHHSELHPVYAMFIHVDSVNVSPTVTQDHWAFFVRNWGDEGFCGGGRVWLNNGSPLQAILQFNLADFAPATTTRGIRAPQPTTLVSQQSVVLPYAHDDGTLFATCSLQDCMQRSAFSPDNGALTFILPPEDCKCGFVGDLTIQRGAVMTSATSPTPAPHRRPAASNEEDVDGDPAFEARVSRLTPADQQQLQTGVADLLRQSRRKVTVAHVEAKRISAPPLATHPTPVTGKGLKIVPDPSRNVRQAKIRQFVDAFLKAHGIN